GDRVSGPRLFFSRAIAGRSRAAVPPIRRSLDQNPIRTPARKRRPSVSKKTGFVGYRLPPGAIGGSLSNRLLTTQKSCRTRSLPDCSKSYEPDQLKYVRLSTSLSVTVSGCVFVGAPAG